MGIQPAAPNFDGEIGRMAEALVCDSSYESSILSSRPSWARGVTRSIDGLQPSGIGADPIVSTRFNGYGTRRQSARLKLSWPAFDSRRSHHIHAPVKDLDLVGHFGWPYHRVKGAN